MFLLISSEVPLFSSDEVFGRNLIKAFLFPAPPVFFFFVWFRRHGGLTELIRLPQVYCVSPPVLPLFSPRDTNLFPSAPIRRQSSVNCINLEAHVSLSHLFRRLAAVSLPGHFRSPSSQWLMIFIFPVETPFSSRCLVRLTSLFFSRCVGDSRYSHSLSRLPLLTWRTKVSLFPFLDKRRICVPLGQDFCRFSFEPLEQNPCSALFLLNSVSSPPSQPLGLPDHSITETFFCLKKDPLSLFKPPPSFPANEPR